MCGGYRPCAWKAEQERRLPDTGSRWRHCTEYRAEGFRSVFGCLGISSDEEMAEDRVLETNLLCTGWPYTGISTQFYRLENRPTRRDWTVGRRGAIRSAHRRVSKMAKTAIVGPNPRHTAQMAAQERLGELVTILAAGVVRLRIRETSKLKMGDARQFPSQVLAEPVHVRMAPIRDITRSTSLLPV
jgi:hypothetical protein